MAAPTVKVVKGADGGYALVSTLEGVVVTFSVVNPSQLAELKAAKAASPEAPGAEGVVEGEG